MAKKEIKQIKKINQLKREINKTIQRYLEKNYTEREIIEATIQRGEEIGFFRNKPKKSNKKNNIKD